MHGREGKGREHVTGQLWGDRQDADGHTSEPFGAGHFRCIKASESGLLGWQGAWADQEATGNTHLSHGLLPRTLIWYSSLT